MEARKISELQAPEYHMVLDTEEINYILELIGSDLYYPCLIVKLGDGEYTEVWGTSYVPYLDNFADRLL